MLLVLFSSGNAVGEGVVRGEMVGESEGRALQNAGQALPVPLWEGATRGRKGLGGAS